LTVGVGHGDEVEPLSDVRCPDASSAQIGRPDGVACGFQVSRYSVEPRPAVAARNLLSKEDCRAALADELGDDGPEVAVVVNAATLAGRRERLAGTACGPDGAIVGPAGEAQSVGPSADAGEEVDLRQSSKVSCSNVADRSLIDGPIGDVTRRDQVA
jgi:hypothetical protein